MRKYTAVTAFALTSIIASIILAACTKDTGFKVVKIYTPVYKAAAEIRAAIKTSDPEGVGLPGKMFLSGNYIFLNEVNKGIHIIDNSNPSSPVNKGFISIPGNLDISVKGNTLYADCFTDLLVIDISNVANVQFKKFFHNIFIDRSSVLGNSIPDGQVIVDWKVRDTTENLSVVQGQGIWRNNEYYFNPGWSGGIMFDQAYYASASTKSVNGVAGSTARLALLNNYLYTVSRSTLTSFNVANAAEPQLGTASNTSVDAETIFAVKNKLFIGGSTGISIFSADNASAPAYEGSFGHFCSGDPVIADDSIAYVTLHTGNWCNDEMNELDVLDVSNISQPQLIKTYPLTSPNGLSKDGNLLFICDGTDGLKIFDATKANSITQIKSIAINHPTDVICYNKVAFVSAKDGLYQFDYSDINHIKLLSKIGLMQ